MWNDSTSSTHVYCKACGLLVPIGGLQNHVCAASPIIDERTRFALRLLNAVEEVMEKEKGN